MLEAVLPHSNILGTGYAVQWVFRGREFAGPGKIGPGWGATVGRRGGDLGRRTAVVVQAGSASSLPASILQNQALSASRLAVVAPSPSHRDCGSADFRAFEGACRLIASFQTGAIDQRGAARPVPSSARRAGGVAPLSIDARIPDGGRVDQTSVFKKPGRSAPSPSGCIGAALAGARKLRAGNPGSGVAVPVRRANAVCGSGSSAKSGIEGVRGRKGARPCFDLGGTATLGGALG